MRVRILKRGRKILSRIEACAILKSGLLEVYQPVPWLGIKGAHRHESTWQRWRAIDRELGVMTGSAMDVGCSLGFFTFQMALRGFFCLGIEGDSLQYHLCNLIKEAAGVENSVFARLSITSQDCDMLPQVDVTIFLSVFHHVVMFAGLEEATRLLMGLLRKTRRVLFFETGQSNETGVTWRKYLPDMGLDPKAWIEEYLRSVGASRVVDLGCYSTHLSDVRRTLFAVYVG